jgi:uncharacterized protein YceK
LTALAIPVLAGCGTIIEHDDREHAEHRHLSGFEGGYGVYGGLRADVEEAATSDGPWERATARGEVADPDAGKTPRFIVRLYAFLDIPLSAGLDTAILPFTAVGALFYSEPSPPRARP